MGYILNISCDSNGVYLDKFYGYVDHEDLKSIKWLIDHNKLKEFDNDPDVFYWIQVGPDISFTAEEFREWFDLYIEDSEKDYLSDTKIKAIYENDKPKIVSWY